MSIRANLIIPRGEEQARAIKLLGKAKGLCLVARALAIKQTLEPAVKVAAPGAGPGVTVGSSKGILNILG
jgi:hypothetical protein